MPTMTEEEINAAHKAAYADAAEQYGGIYKIPFNVEMEIGQKTRENWVQFVEERDGLVVDPANRHDKTDKLVAALKSMVGQTVTIPRLIELGGCARSTIYEFISDNRSMFVKAGRGAYTVIDTDVARAADKGEAKLTAIALDAMNGIRAEAGKP